MASSSPPRPKDFSHYYSGVVKRTEKSLIKRFYKYFNLPGIGNLAGGLPDPAYFPYDTLEARTALPDRFEPTPVEPVQPAPPYAEPTKSTPSTTSSHIVVPHDSTQPDRNQKVDLATALQYGTGQGLPPLRLWLREFARTKMHPNVPYEGGPDVILTCGSTDGFAKTLHLFTELWDGQRDWVRDRQGVLCEEFAYMNAIQAVKPRGLNVAPVAVDAQGMVVGGPGGLKDVLENWDFRQGRLPHLMYTVTVGQNPTSGVLSLQRKKQIYEICQKHDIIIVEDDPYWFLQFPSANELSTQYRGSPISVSMNGSDFDPQWKSSGSPFLDSLVPSYLSIDTDGRVVRLDTFSKTIAPGCRLGWITAQPEIVNRVFSFTDLSTQQPSGFVQSMVAELVLGPDTPRGSQISKSGWQVDGWIRWLEGLRGNYERRMHIVSDVLEGGKYKIDAMANSQEHYTNAHIQDFEVVTKVQLYDFNFPMGGMFLWLQVLFENHPLFEHPHIPADELAWAMWVFLTTVEYRVLVAPGGIFCPTDKVKEEKGWKYLRICFVALPDQLLEKMSHNFVQGLNDFFDIVDPQKIKDIIKDDKERPYVSASQLGRDETNTLLANQFVY